MRGHLRDLADLTGHPAQVGGLLAQQQGQPVRGLGRGGLQGGHLGAAEGEQAVGLVDLEPAGQAKGKLAVHQFAGLLLQADGVAGDGQPVLGGAQFQVGARHLGGEGDERVAVLLDARLEGGVRRLHPSLDAAEQVEFPGCVEPGREQVLAAARVAGVVAAPAGGVAAGRVHRGQGAGCDQASLTAGLADPGRGDAQVRAVGGGPGDKGVQGGVVEQGPPAGKRGDIRCLAVIRAAAPPGGQVQRGRLVVRADRRAPGQQQGKQTEQPVAAGGGHGVQGTHCDRTGRAERLGSGGAVRCRGSSSRRVRVVESTGRNNRIRTPDRGGGSREAFFPFSAPRRGRPRPAGCGRGRSARRAGPCAPAGCSA